MIHVLAFAAAFLSIVNATPAPSLARLVSRAGLCTEEESAIDGYYFGMAIASLMAFLVFFLGGFLCFRQRRLRTALATVTVLQQEVSQFRGAPVATKQPA
ncbi:hypothetical protein MIND_01265100 [Mycena indigotica]|uniref:Uncharacterized protein n=1 Tax=Mycena indigotica TaxID=2126181 RepID=A0A8H6S1X4_9AGAR|nr:uncharacterized protein MIND_01265100 [Mycena indigotica]KAF7291216.1 hypothetical protein MIND_01265100 [Mycena indigotica]